MPHQAIWAIFLVPIISFVIISFFLRPFLNNKPKISGYTTILAIGISLVLSIWTFFEVMAAEHHILKIPTVEWAVIGDTVIRLSLMVDSLTAIMLIVVTVVSLMVQIYSQGYMRGDPGYPRYYAFMSLFTGSMLGLVLGGNLIQVYVFWELVGLCSYLLIGFWFHRPSAAAAAKKAFLVTRLGDFGFLAAILFLYFKTPGHTLDISQLHQLAVTGAIAGSTLTWAAIGIFSGAVGKSAQFPLHTWLPDAMEGPTPVSALIHAATMVTAGVYLVARTFPLFEHSITAMTAVAVIGGFTAIFAASMGLVANDIKRVLAYSTVSQLGYMMLALGAGCLPAAIFHLFNHAFFKALLFLGSGSVNHATGTFDMRLMGGLRKKMPWTYITFLIASISIAGIWPLAGFWSKDEILASAWNLAGPRQIMFYLAMITVFMTAFYMFRAVFMTFHGEYRGGVAPEHGHSSHSSHGEHGPALHESPLVMIVPLVILAVLSVCSGWINLNGWFGEFMGEHGEAPGLFAIFTHPLPWISLIVALLGIFVAYLMYIRKSISAEKVGSIFKPLYTTFSRKYWVDELYEKIFVGKVLVDGLFKVFQVFDTYVVDGTVNGVGKGTIGSGSILRKLQSGQLQVYAFSIIIGVLIILGCFYIWG